MRMITGSVIAIFLSLFITSCSSHRHAEKSIPANGEDKLLFLIVHLQSDPTGRIIKAVLVNKIMTSGTIKKDPSAGDNSFPDQLILQLTDQHNKTIQKLFFPNPLIRHVEYNDSSGMLMSKDIVLQEADFTARIMIPGEVKNIEIYHQKEKELYLIHKLNL